MRMILAIDEAGGLGNNGGLPWPWIPGDLARFKRLTDGCAVVMGRRTWESLPLAPLPGRLNMVLTRRTDLEQVRGRHLVPSLEAAKRVARIEGLPLWVIGGAEVYNLAAAGPDLDLVDLTLVHGTFEADTHFAVPGHWQLTHEEVEDMVTRRTYVPARSAG